MIRRDCSAGCLHSLTDSSTMSIKERRTKNRWKNSYELLKCTC